MGDVIDIGYAKMARYLNDKGAVVPGTYYSDLEPFAGALGGWLVWICCRRIDMPDYMAVTVNATTEEGCRELAMKLVMLLNGGNGK